MEHSTHPNLLPSSLEPRATAYRPTSAVSGKSTARKLQMYLPSKIPVPPQIRRRITGPNVRVPEPSAARGGSHPCWVVQSRPWALGMCGVRGHDDERREVRGARARRHYKPSRNPPRGLPVCTRQGLGVRSTIIQGRAARFGSGGHYERFYALSPDSRVLGVGENHAFTHIKRAFTRPHQDGCDGWR